MPQLRGRPPVLHQLTRFELHDSIAEVVVAVVVADHHDGLSAGDEVGQQARVENLAVVDVLIRRPLVEDVDRPVFGERSIPFGRRENVYGQPASRPILPGA